MKMHKSLIGKAVKKAMVVSCLVAVTTSGALAAVGDRYAQRAEKYRSC